MSDPKNSSKFLDRLNEGRDSALDDLVERYLNRLQALVTRKMGPHIAEKREDVVQSVLSRLRSLGVRELEEVEASDEKVAFTLPQLGPPLNARKEDD